MEIISKNMPLKVKQITIKEIRHWHKDNELDLDPDFQRREVWDEKKKMLLIDSIARGIPINALTLYESKSEDGTKYEVIDGKQRLSALFSYLDGKIIPNSKDIDEESEEEEEEAKDKAQAIADKKWAEVTRKNQDEFQKYEIPVYFVAGSRESAVRAFRRMNEKAYPLSPQEIRNAVFKNSHFVITVRKLAEELKSELKLDDDLLVAWGVVSENSWTRMQDIQFLSELLILFMDGPQNRRQTLDKFYNEYLGAKHKDKGRLDRFAKELKKALKKIYEVMGESLKPNFHQENNAYSLVGAFITKNNLYKSLELNDPDLRSEIKELLLNFGDQICLYIEELKQEPVPEKGETAPEVAEFASTLIRGQQNSQKRREKRIGIIEKILLERLTPHDPSSPSEIQRRIVWAKSKDKKCGRCGTRVEKYDDYDCGHVDAKAHGGRCIISNLQVEHKKCNRSHNQHRIKLDGVRKSGPSKGN